MKEELYGWDSTNVRRLTEESRSKEISTDLKISIVIPTLNQADTIESTLQSIIQQDYHNYEIIIMDGGSTDNTLKILDEYSDSITHLQSGYDRGQSDAINRGFNLATGSIFAWINSDDYYMPNVFSKVVSLFNERVDVDVVVGGGNIVTKENTFLKHIKPMHMTRSNLLKWKDDIWIMQQSVFWSSKIWKKCGGVDDSLHLLMDFDLWLSFSLHCNSEILNEDIGVMRYYTTAKTVSLRNSTQEELGYVYAKHQAFNELRDLLRELNTQNSALYKEIENRDRKLITRIMKRLLVRK